MAFIRLEILNYKVLKYFLMNLLKGTIASINVNGSLSLVRIDVNQIMLTAIVIDTPETASYLKIGNVVNVIFKETEVIIGKGTEHHISLRNKLVGLIEQIDSGELLAKITMNTAAGKVTSIITSNAVRQLQLKTGEEVTAMIKTNEMMLSI